MKDMLLIGESFKIKQMYSLEYNHIQYQINQVNESMKELNNKKMIKYLLIEVNEDNIEILNHIPADKIIDECNMSEDMVDIIGCPVIYTP